MLPGGDDERAWTLAQGVIVNDGSGNQTTGNYTYGFSGQARSPGHDPGIRTSGTLRGFPRKRLDVWALIARCLSQGDQQLFNWAGTATLAPEDTDI